MENEEKLKDMDEKYIPVNNCSFNIPHLHKKNKTNKY